MSAFRNVRSDLHVNAPIDPCGYVVSVRRSCSRQQVKFYNNSDDLSLIETYHCPVGTPVLPIPTCFGAAIWFDDDFYNDPTTGQAGELLAQVAYSKGILPAEWEEPTHYIGTPAQWLNGCDINTDPPLEYNDEGLCCECNPNYCLDGSYYCLDGAYYCLDGAYYCLDGAYYCLQNPATPVSKYYCLESPGGGGGCDCDPLPDTLYCCLNGGLVGTCYFTALPFNGLFNWIATTSDGIWTIDFGCSSGGGSPCYLCGVATGGGFNEQFGCFTIVSCSPLHLTATGNFGGTMAIYDTPSVPCC